MKPSTRTSYARVTALVDREQARGLPGLDEDELGKIVRDLNLIRFTSLLEADFEKGNLDLPNRQAEKMAIEDVEIVLRTARLVMQQIANESTPWHAREWFLDEALDALENFLWDPKGRTA